MNCTSRISALGLLGLLAALLVLPTRDGRRAPALAQEAGRCTGVADKAIAPERVQLGQELTVTMTVQADCTGRQLPVHAALIFDTSYAMGGPRINHMKRGVEAFVEALDFSVSRVGLAAYYGHGDILTELTDDPQQVVDAAQAFFPQPGSDMTMAVRAGRQMLERGRHLAVSDDVLEVIVLLSGSPNEGDPDELLGEVAKAKAAGMLVVTIAAGGDAEIDTLEQIATAPTFFYVEGTSSRYPSLFREIVGDLSTVSLTGATVTDRLPEVLTYVWGSGIPAPRVSEGELRWSYALWPEDGITITYGLMCDELGTHPVSLGAEVMLEVDRGAPQTLDVAVPTVECVPPPTATPPPPTPTAAPQPTVEVRPVYLPFLWREHCRKGTQFADIVLVLDGSSSMFQRAAGGRLKLDLAQDAASQFVDALALPGDRAAVIVFSGEAELLQPLTGNGTALQLALAALHGHVGTGSRLDLGLARAKAELDSAAGERGNAPVIVVLTDGLADPQRTRAAAQAVRTDGVTIYAIGLGGDIDEPLLVEVAGDPGRYYFSPDGADLARIYLDIARATGCGLPVP